MDAAPFSISDTPLDGAHLLVVSGELDVATAPKLMAVIDGIVDAGMKRITIDLIDTTFVDSSGIFTLIKARNRLHERGGDIAVICPPGPIKDILHTAGVEDVLNVRVGPGADNPDIA